jgi:Tfp pilus assembly protein PilN
MKWNQFGSSPSVAEQRAIRTWLLYTVCSSTLLIGHILFDIAHNWYTHQADSVQNADTSAQTALPAALQEKGALKKEVEQLSKKQHELARIRQQSANPFRLLQELHALFAGRITLMSFAVEDTRVTVTLLAADRATYDQFMHKIATLPDTQKLELQSLELLADGVVQVNLSGHL